MIVFGGRVSDTAFADNYVYALDFSVTPARWDRLTLRPGSPSPPAAREGHTLVMDSTGVMNRSGATPPTNWSRAVLYGGNTGTANGEVWMLWINPNSPNEVEWQQVNPAQGPPPARSGHSAVWLRSPKQIMIFGGDTGGTSDGNVWLLDVTWPTSGNNTDFAPKWIAQPWASALPVSGQTAIRDFTEIQALDPELYDPTKPSNSRWSLLGAPKRYAYYPAMFVLPSGNVFMAGPVPDAWRLKLVGSGAPAWDLSPMTSHFWGKTAAMYRPGKIMKCEEAGSGFDTDRIEFSGATDVNAGWIGSSGFEDRKQHNVTLLPDGRVIATGGLRKDPNNPTQYIPAKGPQIWDPNGNGGAGSWTPYLELEEETAVRRHHSAAILLPDGRILSGSEGEHPIERTIYSPPYLFTSNGLAARPTISNVPTTVPYGVQFTILTPDGLNISRVSLLRPSTVTHEFNQNQRYDSLTITAKRCDHIVVNSPANANLDPPGDYLLFLVSSTGVPSIGKWIRVQANAPGDYIAPGTITNLSVAYAGRSTVVLNWTASGDDGNTGTATAFDLRYSQSSITDGTFCAAVPVTIVPTPGPSGTPHCGDVSGLSPCRIYYFALRARDEGTTIYNWSSLSNVASAYTTCTGYQDYYCDGGLMAGGGGGGSAPSAGLREASVGEVAGAALSSSWENSLLWGTQASQASDLYELGAVPSPSGGNYLLNVWQTGSRQTDLDELSLGAVDHDPGLAAVAGGDSVYLGILGSVASVTDAAGSDIKSTLGESRVIGAGQELTIRLSEALSGAALVVESSAVPGTADSAGILVQQQNGDSRWTTLTTIHPRRNPDSYAVRATGNRPLRLVFLRDCWLNAVGQLVVTKTTVPQPLPLSQAEHSRLGNVSGAISAKGGEMATLLPGETVSLAFTESQLSPSKMRALFLSARGTQKAVSGSSPASAGMSGSAAAANPAWQFELAPARPNPSPGNVTFAFTMAQEGPMSLRIYDVAGRLVRTLVDGRAAAGPHKLEWNATDDGGRRVRAGVYFYRMTAGSWRSQQKVVFVER